MIIKYQIGRQPENLSKIEVYCPFDKPAVLLTLPYSEENGVFPTSHWLSCPYLVREVAKLEDEGLVKKLSSIIADNADFRMKLMKAHKRYAANRLKYLSDSMKNKIKKKSLGMYKVLVESGVGGIMEKEGVKCLHTHLADFLVMGDNPIGELIWKQVDWPEDCHFCDQDNVEKNL